MRVLLRLLPSVLLLLCVLFPLNALAADNLFNSSAAWKEEFLRLGGEAKTMVVSPVDAYPWQTVAAFGAFALSVGFDREIRSDLAPVRSRGLDRATDAGNFLGETYLHLGIAAAVYTSGVIADAPRAVDLGTKIGEALLLADGAGFIIKTATGRGRPEGQLSNDRFRPFSFRDSYGSLPSLHTASSFALAHVLSRETDSLPAQIACYAAAGFVGFSRVYQDQHWASDIVLGAALGELAGSAVTRYRGGKITVAPMASGGATGIAVTGRF